MKVYVFGNRDLPEDNVAFKVAEKLRKDLKEIEFVEVKPNEDLPFASGEDVVIMDVVEGLDKVSALDLNVIPGGDLGSSFSWALDSGSPSGMTKGTVGKVVSPPRNSVHDFDLGFQLKYLKKLGKLGNVKIIGIPQNGEINYDSIHSILRKLVAQDIQGS